DVLDVGRLGQLLVGHHRVARAEIDRSLGDLLDSSSRSDRLVIELQVRVKLVVVAKSLRVERIGKGRARSIYQQRLRSRGCRAQCQTDRENLFHVFSSALRSWQIAVPTRALAGNRP